MATLILYPSDLLDPSKGVTEIGNIKDSSALASGSADIVVFKDGADLTIIKSAEPVYG